MNRKILFYDKINKDNKLKEAQIKLLSDKNIRNKFTIDTIEKYIKIKNLSDKNKFLINLM